ncbi:MAG: nucleotidyltransferase [Ignavibacteriae bacterium HGW-Ignavibacteriae-4]|jgi:hypothetical protein|nr:MAG: nucleotidyltransferase [Ignavibacteriae bacterium HGW-Ignavibacteriae-4]
MKLTAKHIELIKNYFQDKPIIRAYLFGSVVRNTADNENDIDILVELDYSKSIGLLFVRMQRELGELLGRKVDLVSTKGISKYISPTVNKERQLIYAR